MDNVGECAVVQYILRVRDREEDAHELNEWNEKRAKKRKNKRIKRKEKMPTN